MTTKSVERPEPPVDMSLSLTRKLIWDIVPCNRIDDELLDLFDLVPSSEEGEEIEHRESHRRLAQMMKIVQPTTLLGAVAGKVIATTVLDNEGLDEDDFEYEDRYHEMIKAAIAGSRAVVANLLDAGILILGPGNAGNL